LRTEGAERDSLIFFNNQLVAGVAKRTTASRAILT
jgi:hypothetical protein